VGREVHRLRHKIWRDVDDGAPGERQGLDRLNPEHRAVLVEDRLLQQLTRGCAVDDGRLPLGGVPGLEWDHVAHRRPESILVGIVLPDILDSDEGQDRLPGGPDATYPDDAAHAGVPTWRDPELDGD